MQRRNETIRRRAAVSPTARGGYTRITIATQSPSIRFDASKGTSRSEVLLLNGVRWRTDRRQLPLVDSHNRDSVRGVLGSVRNCAVEHGKLVGNLFWARDPLSQAVARKVADGHELQFTVDFAAREILELYAGQQHKGFVGPADLVTSWVPLSVSVTVGS